MSNPWIAKLRACSAEYQEEKKKAEETKKKRIRDIKYELHDLWISYPQRGQYNQGAAGTRFRPMLEKRYKELSDELFKLTGERAEPIKNSERGFKKAARKELSKEIQEEIYAERKGIKKKDTGREFKEGKRKPKIKAAINF